MFQHSRPVFEVDRALGVVDLNSELVQLLPDLGIVLLVQPSLFDSAQDTIAGEIPSLPLVVISQLADNFGNQHCFSGGRSTRDDILHL
jgi:hypothetical protein